MMVPTGIYFPKLFSFWSILASIFVFFRFWSLFPALIFPPFPLRLILYRPRVVFMPREQGKPIRASGSHSGLRGRDHSDYRSLGYGCDCSCHSVMDHRTPLPMIVVEDTKTTLSPPSSFIPTLPVPNPDNASNSQIPPPSPPGFTIVQCDLILALRRDNDEQKFR